VERLDAAVEQRRETCQIADVARGDAALFEERLVPPVA